MAGAPDSAPQIESHPWQPFIPDRAKVLIAGTFPPKSSRWCMDFYYPNRINDFWRVMGSVFFDNPDRFWDALTGTFRLDDIKAFLTERRIAMHDTAAQVRRLRDNASDKYLEIVTPVNLGALLSLMPECTAIATTGQKAAEVIAKITDTPVPAVTGGDCGSEPPFVEFESPVAPGKFIRHYRLPSTSRAYPMPLVRKAAAYAAFFSACGCAPTGRPC